MRDIVLYCSNTAALLAEAAALIPPRVIFDELGNPVKVTWDKTPTVRNANGETVSLIRVTTAERDIIATMTSVTLLADVPAYDDYLVAMSAANRTVYDGVYDQSMQSVQLPDGSTFSFTPPPHIGRFM